MITTDTLTNTKRTIEIGELVTWVINGKTRTGIYIEDDGIHANVNSLFVDKQPINLKCSVPIELITLAN